MRTPASAALTVLIFILVAPFLSAEAASRARPSRAPSPVTLHVAAGYGGQYRASAWVPIRVTLHSQSSTALSGTIFTSDRGPNSQFATPSFYSIYQLPVTLPPASTKQVTLYLPGSDVGDTVRVQLRRGSQVLGSGAVAPSSFSDGTVSIGTLAGDPQSVSWLRRAGLTRTGVSVVVLSPATLDPVPQALASFDAIVLTNADTSRLDSAQVEALETYARHGGSLLLVGGPDWQETLRPLPASLLPGRLAGSRKVGDLSGLQTLGAGRPPNRPTIVSVLTRPRGKVMATEGGIPLVVREAMGEGRIIYLAFDPSVDAIPQWRQAGHLLTALVRQVTPQVVNRESFNGFQSGFFQGRFGAGAMRTELANVPSPTRPMLVLLAVLAVLSVLVLGPVNFLLFHRLGRIELAWGMIPLLAALCLGSTVATISHFKGNLVLLNTVSVVQMDGAGRAHPTSLYVGLFSSVKDDYHLVWNGSGLPQSLPGYTFDGTSSGANLPLGLRLQEGTTTAIDFPSMNMWSAREVALQTSVTIPGSIQGDLSVSPDGSVTGTVRNGTDLTLDHPALLAGSAVLRLGDLRAHTSRFVHIMPRAEPPTIDHPLLWDRVYGTSALSSQLQAWDGDPWEEPQPAPETSLLARLHNVGERLPESRDLTSLGQVVLVGWNQDSLGSFTVDGATPRRRDLNLIVTPLDVHFPPGQFRLRPGTLAASLVDGIPQPPQSGCCLSTVSSQAVGLGAGGAATFQFDLPNAGHIRFQRLALSIDTGGSDDTGHAQVYDWRSERWVSIPIRTDGTTLPDPNRFISQGGALLVRFTATHSTGDIVIADPRSDLQLSGTGMVS